MDADKVLWTELAQRGVTDVRQLASNEIVDLGLRYAVWVPVHTYVNAPWIAPYAIRKTRIRHDPRAPGPKRDLWGLPDERGYFADDNSLIKGVFKNRLISAPSPYGSGQLRRGMVCCHVWAGTTTEPLLFSFIPNLVWLPRTLAPFSDAHHAGPAHALHETLKHVSTQRYRTADLRVADQRAASAWSLLPVEGGCADCFFGQSEFVLEDKLVKLINGRLRKLTGFLEATLDESAYPPPRFSKRYHAGVGSRIDSTVWPVQRAVSESARLQLLQELKDCASVSSVDGDL